jgi:hypothetical protein
VEIFQPPFTWGAASLSLERRRRRKRSGAVVRDTTFRVIKKESIFPVLKVPRPCPLVLLIEAAHFMCGQNI